MPARSHTIAKLALAATLALAAPAAARHHVRTDHQPGADGGAMVTAAANLGPSPDAHVDVAKVRGIHPRSSGGHVSPMRTSSNAQPAGKSVDLKVLLLSADGTEPTYHWWKTALTNEGVPFDTIVGSTADPITADTLRAGADHGRYDAVVLATGGLAYSPDGGFTYVSALSGDEWAALQAYEREFAVREVDAYAYPQAAYGLSAVGSGRDMSGVEAHVTDTGASVFADLVGPVPIDRWSWGYEGAPVAGSSWQTLVADDAGAVVGSYVRDDGTEALVNTVDTNEWSIHGHELFNGMLEWVTRGVHLGMRRNYFRVDVDDLFLPDDRWNMTSHATPEDGSSTVRMVPADVDRAVAWEHSTGIHLNFLFNADGAKADDPLTQALLAAKGDFTWENHTFSHPDLDPADLTTIESEIRKNIEFAQANALPFDPTELVTGGHSGLANAAMPQALTETGIRFFGADASRQPDQYALGSALSVPRHPTGIYYNVGTRAEELDEYNYLNHTACPSGNPGCLSSEADWPTLVDNEASMILRHVLDNDPRPHYVHQSNLAEDGTMYPIVDEVLARYHRLFKPDLVQPSLTESGRQLQRMSAWQAAVAAGTVGATLTPNGQIVVHSPGDVPVPITGGPVGDTYAGTTSGWTDPAAGDTTIGTDPTPAPSSDPAPSTDPAPSSDPTPSTDPTPPPPADPGSGDATSMLLAHWTFDSNDGASELPDSAGGHTGYWRNGPPAFDGGGAVDFPGGPLYVEVNGIAAPSDAYTLEVSVRPDGAGDMTFAEHGGGGALGIVGGHITFRNVGDDVTAPDPVEPGSWYDVAGTWDGSTARLYVDGRLVASASSSSRPSGSSTLYLGRGAMAGFMNGLIDDVAYYHGVHVPDPPAPGAAEEPRTAATTSPQSDAPDSPETPAPASNAVAPHVVSAASSKSGRPSPKGRSKKAPRKRHRAHHAQNRTKHATRR